MTDRQKVCKCGNAVGDLLGRISGFKGNLERVSFEQSLRMEVFRESVNYVYGGITNVESYCDIDAREEQQLSMDAFDKISRIETAKESTVFEQSKNQILSDLIKIRIGITNKVRDCSR